MKKFPAWLKCGAYAVTAVSLLWIPYFTAAGGDAPADTSIPVAMIPIQPVPYSAKYSVITSGATVAEASYVLSRSEQGWEFRAHAKPTKMVSFFISAEISEYSLLEIDGTQVRPLRYQYEQKADKEKDRKMLRAQYDWLDNTVTVSDGNKNHKLAIGADTHDPLSAQLALALCIKSGCPEARYSVLDEMELQKRRFERIATESIQTTLGDYETVKVGYRRGKRETFTWLAPALDYVPVRIQQFRNGELKSEMRITSVNFK